VIFDVGMFIVTLTAYSCNDFYVTFTANTFHSTSGMDSQQQFCLKWNSFGSNLATSFGNLFKSESLTDVTLFCEGNLCLL